MRLCFYRKETNSEKKLILTEIVLRALPQIGKGITTEVGPYTAGTRITLICLASGKFLLNDVYFSIDEFAYMQEAREY